MEVLLHQPMRSWWSIVSPAEPLAEGECRVSSAESRALGNMFSLPCPVAPYCRTAADGLNVTLNGVLRGCGRQALGARLQLCTYWLLGVPASWWVVRDALGWMGETPWGLALLFGHRHRHVVVQPLGKLLPAVAAGIVQEQRSFQGKTNVHFS
jgi:hypothetical protein